jgi:hypothetical protein
VYNGVYQASYQLGYQLGRWLFSSGSNPQAELEKQLMMQELARREAEAERLHQEEEAQRIAIIYNRLYATLKLSGLPNLQLKEIASDSPGLRLKLGDSPDGQAGIKGLPGIYLNDGKVPYGIPGLPGIYTGGPGQGSGLTNSKLALKIGEGSTASAQAANASPVTAGLNGSGQSSGTPVTATDAPAPAVADASGLQLKTGGSNTAPAAQPTTLDPSKMSPQQLADVAEMVSKLPPEEQQRLMAAAQKDAAAGQPVPGSTGQPSAQALAPLQQQAAASQAAATAPGLEDASAKARGGFDTALGPAATQQIAATASAQPPAASPQAPASAAAVNPQIATPESTSILQANAAQLAIPKAAGNPALPTAQLPRSQTDDQRQSGAKAMECARGRITRDRLAAGLPVQLEAIKRTEAQMEAARKGVEDARAESKAVLLKGAIEEVKTYAEEVLTSADALRGQIETLGGLDKAKRDMLIRTVNTIAFGGEDLYQAGKTGYVAGEELQKKVDSLSHQIATLTMESGIVEKAGEELSGKLWGPLGELGFRSVKVSIDLSVALGGGMISKRDQQVAQRNLDTMLAQYERAKEQISELDRDLNELCK